MYVHLSCGQKLDIAIPGMKPEMGREAVADEWLCNRDLAARLVRLGKIETFEISKMKASRLRVHG